MENTQYNQGTQDTNKPQPSYVGDGLAIWKNTDKNGKTFLSVRVLGGKGINCFKNVPKVKEVIQDDF